MIVSVAAVRRCPVVLCGLVAIILPLWLLRRGLATGTAVAVGLGVSSPSWRVAVVPSRAVILPTTELVTWGVEVLEVAF